MAISTTGSQALYTGTNSPNQVCPFPYIFFANTDLEVVTLDASNVSRTLVLGTDYSVTGANNTLGGSVTIFLAVPTTTTISIVRNNPETQLVSLTTGDRFPASIMERALDKLTMLVQELSRAVSKSLRVSDVSVAQPDLSPLPASVITTNASNQLQFSSTSSATGTAPFFLAATTRGGQPTFQPIPTGAVGTTQIASGAVGSTQLATGAVGSTQLANGAVNATQLATGAVTSDKLATGAVGTTQLATGAVTAEKISTGGVGSTQIAAGAVTSTQLATGAVGSTQMATGSVGATQLANGAVTSDKLASGAVNSTQLATGAVTSDKISNGAITETKIAAGAVGNTQLGMESVTGDKIAAGSVGSGELATGAVGTTQLATGAVTPIKVGGQPATGQFVLGTSAGVVAWQTPGSVSLQDNSVTSAKIVDGAVINSKIADNTISSQKLQIGAVGANQIATGAVGATQLGVGSVGNNQLAIAAVSNENLADSSVTNAKVSTNAAIDGSKIVPAFGSQNISSTGNISVGTAQNTCRATIFDSTANPALLINQQGSGHAIRVEDETNPDSTPFVVDASGSVGIGKVTPAQKLDVVGNGVFTGGVTALNTPKVACSWAGSVITTGTIALAGNTITATAGSQSVTWVRNTAWATSEIGMVYYITNIANVAGATLGGRVVTNAGATDINAVGFRITAISGTTATCTLLAGAATAGQTITGNGLATGFTFATFGLRHSYGVSSIVRNVAGDYTINFSTPFNITNYTWLTGGLVACSNIQSYGGANIRLTFAAESPWHQFAAFGNL